MLVFSLWFQLYDGPQRMGRFCGTDIPPSGSTTGSKFHVLFYTDGVSHHEKGFQMQWFIQGKLPPTPCWSQSYLVVALWPRIIPFSIPRLKTIPSTERGTLMVPGFRKFTQTLMALREWNPLAVKTGSEVQVDRIWVSALGSAAVSHLREGRSIRKFQGLKTWSWLWQADHKVRWSLSGECNRMRFKTHLDIDQRRNDRERKEGVSQRE